MNTPKRGKASSLEDCFQACSISSSGGSPPENHPPPPSTLELNSHLSLPYQWEQCLDLKTGEIYYIDWTDGKKVKDDPRAWLKNTGGGDGGFGYDEDESCDENDSGSISSSSSSSPLEDYLEDSDDVLVAAGCKSCLMYFMVPKMVTECPKCRTTLLHFSGSSKSLL